jgi:hypothetical protein
LGKFFAVYLPLLLLPGAFHHLPPPPLQEYLPMIGIIFFDVTVQVISWKTIVCINSTNHRNGVKKIGTPSALPEDP